MQSLWHTPGLLDRLADLRRDDTLDIAELAARLSFEFRIRLTRSAVKNKLLRLGLGLRANRASTKPLPAVPVKRVPSDTITLAGGQFYRAGTLYQHGTAEARG